MSPTSGSGSGGGSRAGNGRAPWRSNILDVVMLTAVFGAIVAVFVVLGAWGRSLHHQVVVQITRIEASVNEVLDFVRSVRPSIDANRRRIEQVEQQGSDRADRGDARADEVDARDDAQDARGDAQDARQDEAEGENHPR